MQLCVLYRKKMKEKSIDNKLNVNELDLLETMKVGEKRERKKREKEKERQGMIVYLEYLLIC